MPYKSFGFTDHQLMIRDAIVGLMERELPPERIEALEKASAPSRRCSPTTSLCRL